MMSQTEGIFFTRLHLKFFFNNFLNFLWERRVVDHLEVAECNWSPQGLHPVYWCCPFWKCWEPVSSVSSTNLPLLPWFWNHPCGIFSKVFAPFFGTMTKLRGWLAFWRPFWDLRKKIWTSFISFHFAKKFVGDVCSCWRITREWCVKTCVA